jgi:ssDNA-binding Zn-finger/Zn-ribbon topoisomerase 1
MTPCLPNFEEKGTDMEDIELLVYCPLCKSLLHPRQARAGSFLGCSKYPKCKSTRFIKSEYWNAAVDFIHCKRAQAEEAHKKAAEYNSPRYFLYHRQVLMGQVVQDQRFRHSGWVHGWFNPTPAFETIRSLFDELARLNRELYDCPYWPTPEVLGLQQSIQELGIVINLEPGHQLTQVEFLTISGNRASWKVKLLEGATHDSDSGA